MPVLNLPPFIGWSLAENFTLLLPAHVQKPQIFLRIVGQPIQLFRLQNQSGSYIEQPGLGRETMAAAASDKTTRDPENTRLSPSGYIADILLDPRHIARIFHWIVQRVCGYCPLGTGNTFEDAQSAAQSCLDKLAGDEQKSLTRPVPPSSRSRSDQIFYSVIHGADSTNAQAPEARRQVMSVYLLLCRFEAPSL